MRSLHDRDELSALLSRDPALHAYELGDLDDFFWPFTTWYSSGQSVALIYHGGGFPVLLCLCASPSFVSDLAPLLPRRFEAHLTPGLSAALEPHYTVTDNGLHLKMKLGMLTGSGGEGDVLSEADLPEILQLYAEAYPGNWFDARMLQTGQYIGIRRDGVLAAIAGIHVYSPRYRVAALGNVTTHPRWRGQGLAGAAVTQLCRRLLSTVDTITLNVKASNTSAIGVYSRLGFTLAAEYHEYHVSVPPRRSG